MNTMGKIGGIVIFILLLLLLRVGGCHASQFSDGQIANAIFKVENSKTHPYGIMTHFKTTTPRQACLNTIHNQRIRHAKHNCGKDFLTCLRDRYCPLNAVNDPKGLNANWLRLLKYFLTKQTNTIQCV